MKKLISGLSALAMAAAMAMSASAAEANQINQDSDPKQGDSEVTYNVEAAYTVTIPAGADISSGSDVQSITANDVLLESGQKITVTLSGASNTASGKSFSAKDESGESTVNYTIQAGDTDVAVGDKVAEFETKTGEQSATLTFTKDADSTPTFAGKHTETLTFTIEAEGGTQNIEFILATMGALTTEKISLPVPVGKKWQDFATYISNEDFNDAINKAIAHDTSVYPANKFYCNETYGISYYTGDKLYLLFNIVDFNNSATSGLLPSDVVSKTNTYGAQDVLPFMQ